MKKTIRVKEKKNFAGRRKAKAHFFHLKQKFGLRAWLRMEKEVHRRKMLAEQKCLLRFAKLLRWLWLVSIRAEMAMILPLLCLRCTA